MFTSDLIRFVRIKWFHFIRGPPFIFSFFDLNMERKDECNE